MKWQQEVKNGPAAGFCPTQASRCTSSAAGWYSEYWYWGSLNFNFLCPKNLTVFFFQPVRSQINGIPTSLNSWKENCCQIFWAQNVWVERHWYSMCEDFTLVLWAKAVHGGCAESMTECCDAAQCIVCNASNDTFEKDFTVTNMLSPPILVLQPTYDRQLCVVSKGIMIISFWLWKSFLLLCAIYETYKTLFTARIKF